MSAIAVALAAMVSAARGGTIYSTFGPGNSFDTNNFVSFSTGSPNGFADQFTNSSLVQVQSASLAVAAVSPGTTIRFAIQSNSLTGPGAILSTFTFTGTTVSTQPEILTFTGTPFQLFAGNYWVTATVLTGQVEWFENNQGINNITASHTGTGITSGWTQNGLGTALAFDVETVPEPSVGALCLLGVSAMVARWRLRRGTKP